MLVDNFEDFGSTPYTNVVCRSGSAFPALAVVGLLFVHATHGLCVFTHTSQWRKVSR